MISIVLYLFFSKIQYIYIQCIVARLSELYITWVTWNSTQNSFVNLVPTSKITTTFVDKLSHIIKLGIRFSGYERLYVDGGSHHRDYYIHRVLLTELLPNTHYGIKIYSFIYFNESKFIFAYSL